MHVNPSDSSQDIYRAEIRDAGVTGVRRFLVQLANQGVLVNRRVRIAPLQTLAVKLVGPLCNSSAPPTVTADPHHRIAVSSRAQAFSDSDLSRLHERLTGRYPEIDHESRNPS